MGWLHRQADEYDRRGPAGRLVAAELRKLAITAEALGATGPVEHERLLGLLDHEQRSEQPHGHDGGEGEAGGAENLRAHRTAPAWA